MKYWDTVNIAGLAASKGANIVLWALASLLVIATVAGKPREFQGKACRRSHAARAPASRSRAYEPFWFEARHLNGTQTRHITEGPLAPS